MANTKTKARITKCATLTEAGLRDDVRYAVDFKGLLGWRRYHGQTFSTWVGASSWIAAQGAELID